MAGPLSKRYYQSGGGVPPLHPLVREALVKGYQDGGLVKDPITGKMMSYSELSKILQERQRQKVVKQGNVKARNNARTGPSVKLDRSTMTLFGFEDGGEVLPTIQETLVDDSLVVDPVTGRIMFQAELARLLKERKKQNTTQISFPLSLKQGGIVIDPKNKGKFTAEANRRGLGAQEFASKVLSAPEGTYTPLMRKRANFAKNASKWKK